MISFTMHNKENSTLNVYRSSEIGALNKWCQFKKTFHYNHLYLCHTIILTCTRVAYFLIYRPRHLFPSRALECSMFMFYPLAYCLVCFLQCSIPQPCFHPCFSDPSLNAVPHTSNYRCMCHHWCTQCISAGHTRFPTTTPLSPVNL